MKKEEVINTRRMSEITDFKAAVKAFFRFEGVNIQEYEFKINPELNSIVDVSCRDKKFQVKNVPGKDKGMFALLEKGKLKMVSSGINGFEEFKEKFIKEVLRKKVSGKNVTLLLWCNSPFLPPFNRERIIKKINEDRELKKLCQESGYEEICLLDSDKKLPIHHCNK